MPNDHTTSPPTENTVRTRASGSTGKVALWSSVVLTVVIAAALIIFIAQNSQRVQLRYLGADTTISFGVAMLLAAAAGVVLALLIASLVKVRRGLRSR